MKKTAEKIIGHIEKKGSFNGVDYHNYILVVVIEENGIPVSCDCKNLKFKVSELNNVLCVNDITEVYGSYISRAYFDKYGKLIGVDYDGAEYE